MSNRSKIRRQQERLAEVRKAEEGRKAHEDAISRKSRLIIAEHDITTGVIENKYLRGLPQDIKDEINELHDVVIDKPKLAIPRLVKLKEDYPEVPVIYNYLAAAYTSLKKIKEARVIIAENYERNPDYLFAKVNYAEMCIDTGEPEKVPAIFNNKLDLKAVYPERTKFHISEFTGFVGVMSFYYFAIGERERAEIYYDILKQLAPAHYFTRRIRERLQPPLALRLLQKVTRFF